MGIFLNVNPEELREHLKTLIMHTTTGLTEEYEKKLDEIEDPVELWIEVHRTYKFNLRGKIPDLVRDSWKYYNDIKKKEPFSKIRIRI